MENSNSAKNVKNLLVLGAGASVGYGYPTGEKLIEEILKSAKDRFTEKEEDTLYKLHPSFFDVLEKHPDVNIDRFINNNPSLKVAGQRIVCYTLLKFEKSMKEVTKDGWGKDKWYRYLLSNVIDKVRDSGKSGLNEWLRIVTFNYDVSLDFYLLDGLLENEITRPDAIEIFNQIKPIHVYGQLREIRSGSDLFSYGNCEYYDCSSTLGKEKNKDRLRLADSISKNIHIIYGNKGEKDFSNICSGAQNMYFLGFAFDRLNLEKIGLDGFIPLEYSVASYPEEEEENGVIFCTNYGRNLKIRESFRKHFYGYAHEKNLKVKEEDCSVLEAFQQHISL